MTVLAWRVLRGDFRMIRSDRVERIIPDSESFRPRRVVLLRDYIDRLAGAKLMVEKGTS